MPRRPSLTSRLTREVHKVSLPFHKLPQTFRDAIKLPRALGISYNRIDSLCICQDDYEDWLSESKNMGAIYENSYLTIAATSGLDGDSGLYGVDARPVYLRFPVDPVKNSDSSGETGTMYFSDIPASKSRDVDSAPLNERGWVLQERLLSRRVLHFAAAQIYWECRRGVWNQTKPFENQPTWKEDFALSTDLHRLAGEGSLSYGTLREGDLMLSRGHPSGPKESKLRKSHAEFHSAWGEIIVYYSSRAITKTSDRLIAIEGIRQRLKDAFGFSCPAGHWFDTELCFLKSIAWAVGVCYSGGGVGGCTGKMLARAPTWSCFAFENFLLSLRMEAPRMEHLQL